jgi:hypothetical protein
MNWAQLKHKTILKYDDLEFNSPDSDTPTFLPWTLLTGLCLEYMTETLLARYEFVLLQVRFSIVLSFQLKVDRLRFLPVIRFSLLAGFGTRQAHRIYMVKGHLP